MMFKKLSDWFESQLKQPQQTGSRHTVELATAVLLYEIMRADDKFEASEQEVFEHLLDQHFSLSDEEKQTLLNSSAHHAKLSVDFQQFTRVLNENCNMEEKREVLSSLWKIAYADKHIDSHEIHLIRRISDLLQIPHSEFIQAKLKVIDG